MTALTQSISTPELSVTDGSTLAPMLILVGGLPGAGKTYFASRLSERLRAAYVSSDLMRKQMEAQGRYAFEDKLNVYEQMACRAANALRQNNPLVVDATFYCKEMREMFFTLAKLLHLKYALIEIVADEDVIRKRLDRTTAPREANLSVYRLVKSNYEQPDVPYLVIESKEDNVKEMVRTATQYISTVDKSQWNVSKINDVRR